MGLPAPLGVSASGRGPYWPADQANGVVQGSFTAIGPSRPFALWGPANLFIWAPFTTALTTTLAGATGTVASAGAIAAGTAINGANVPPGTTVGALVGTTVTFAFPTYTLAGKTKTGIAKITGLKLTTGLLGAAVSGDGIQPGTVVSNILVAAASPGVAPSAYDGQDGTVELSLPPTSADNIDLQRPFRFALTSQSVVAGADAAAIFTGVPILYTGSVQLERSFDGGHTWIVCNIGAGTPAVFNGGANISISFGEPERQVLYRLNCSAYTGPMPIAYRISETGQASISLSVPALS